MSLLFVSFFFFGAGSLLQSETRRAIPTSRALQRKVSSSVLLASPLRPSFLCYYYSKSLLISLSFCDSCASCGQ